MNKNLLYAAALFCASEAKSEDLTWSSPMIISEGAISVSAPPEPRMEIDGSGNAYAIWGEVGTIKFKTKPFGDVWSASTTLAAMSRNPRIHVDSNGNATVIWITGTTLNTAVRPAGGSFGAPTALAPNALQAELAGDVNGNLVAVWTTPAGVQSKTKLSGGSWAPSPNTLSSTAADNPIVAIGENGTVIATWHSVISSVHTIRAASKSISGNWSAETNISSPARNSINQHVEVDANGNAAAIWYTFDQTGSSYSNVVATAAYKPNSGSWSLPTALSNGGYYNPTNPVGLRARVAFDNEGNAVAIWANSYDGRLFSIETSIRYADGNGIWAEPIPLVENNLYAFFDDIVSPDARDLFGTYHESDGSYAQIQALVANTDTPNGLQWSTRQQISDERSGFSRNTAYLAGDTIYAGSIWLHTDGINGYVVAATATGTLLQPPSNLEVSQNLIDYGSFVEYQNTLSWTPSSSPDISLYHIYRNGLYITTVDGSFTSYVDRNQLENGIAVYEIASVDSKGTQSFKASVSFP